MLKLFGSGIVFLALCANTSSFSYGRQMQNDDEVIAMIILRHGKLAVDIERKLNVAEYSGKISGNRGRSKNFELRVATNAEFSELFFKIKNKRWKVDSTFTDLPKDIQLESIDMDGFADSLRIWFHYGKESRCGTLVAGGKGNYGSIEVDGSGNYDLTYIRFNDACEVEEQSLLAQKMKRVR